jgi:hypothetical protein
MLPRKFNLDEPVELEIDSLEAECCTHLRLTHRPAGEATYCL